MTQQTFVEEALKRKKNTLNKKPTTIALEAKLFIVICEMRERDRHFYWFFPSV